MIQNLIYTSSPYPDNILYEKLEAKIQNLYNNRQFINTPQNKNAQTEKVKKQQTIVTFDHV